MNKLFDMIKKNCRLKYNMVLDSNVIETKIFCRLEKDLECSENVCCNLHVANVIINYVGENKIKKDQERLEKRQARDIERFERLRRVENADGNKRVKRCAELSESAKKRRNTKSVQESNQ